MNLKKLLAFASLGVVGFALVTSVTACNSASVTLMANSIEEIAKQINGHKFTKKDVVLTGKDNEKNIEELKTNISASLTEVLKNKLANFSEIFSITNISESGKDEPLDFTTLTNDETQLKVSYTLKNLKDESKIVKGDFLVNVTKNDKTLTYDSETGFSMEKLTPDFIANLIEKIKDTKLANIEPAKASLDKKLGDIESNIKIEEKSIEQQKNDIANLKAQLTSPGVEDLNKDKDVSANYLNKLDKIITELNDKLVVNKELKKLWDVTEKDNPTFRVLKEKIYKMVPTYFHSTKSSDQAAIAEELRVLDKKLYDLLVQKIDEVGLPKNLDQNLNKLNEEKSKITSKKDKLESLQKYLTEKKSLIKDVEDKYSQLNEDAADLKNSELKTKLVELNTNLTTLSNLLDNVKQ